MTPTDIPDWGTPDGTPVGTTTAAVEVPVVRYTVLGLFTVDGSTFVCHVEATCWQDARQQAYDEYGNQTTDEGEPVGLQIVAVCTSLNDEVKVVDDADFIWPGVD